MGRRRGRKGRGRRSKAIPVLPTVAALYPGLKGVQWWLYESDKKLTSLPVGVIGAYTGYNMDTGAFVSSVPIKVVGLVLGGYVGHKIANKIGVNKYIRKATMGMLTL